jgi:ubiquitin carboxyl-terminal hydrolase 1
MHSGLSSLVSLALVHATPPCLTSGSADLNTPRSQKLALRPHGIVDALAAAEARHRRNAMMHSRQHQDAQELFQLLAEQLKAEAGAVRREARRDRGFALPPSVYGDLAAEDAQLRRSVFDGLTANRRACVRCGYTEAVMHFGFDSWTLALPAGACALEDCLAEYTRLELLTDCVCRRCALRATHAVREELEDCLAEYTRLELLTDCVCRRCALRATHARLAADANRATATAEAEPNPSSSKKRRARDARKYEARVRAMLDEGRIEDELGDIRLERVVEPATKQAMVARVRVPSRSSGLV